MDYLYAVAFIENDLRPMGAADDLSIKLNGEAFGRKRELFHEFGKRDGSRYVARFPVDFDKQFFSDSLQPSFRLDE